MSARAGERRYDMGQSARALGSAVRILLWKIRYGSRLQTSLIQGFDHPHLEIAEGALVRMGTRIQNRGNLYLICAQRGKMQIGGHVFFNTGCSVSCMEEIVIGAYCKIGNNTVIVDHDHNFREGKESPDKNQKNEFLSGEIVIGSRVWIGANVTILRNTHIGDDCVIAAGSIVKGDVPSGTLYCQKRQTEMIPLRGREEYKL